MLRIDYKDLTMSDDLKKGKAFNTLRNEFSSAILKRFVDIRDSIEDIWDLVTNKSFLEARLQTISAKDPSTWTEKNLKDMAIICCILWNDTAPTE